MKHGLHDPVCLRDTHVCFLRGALRFYVFCNDFMEQLKQGLHGPGF